MIPSKQELSDSDIYVDRQNQIQQEQGRKLLLIILNVLAILVGVEHYISHEADDLFSYFSSAYGILFSLGLVIWSISEAKIIKWQTVSISVAVLSALSWLTIGALLKLNGSTPSYCIYGVIFVVSTILAFFSYPPALYLCLGLGLISGLLSSFFIMPPDYHTDLFKIDTMLLMTGVLLCVLLQRTLTFWYRTAVKHTHKSHCLRDELGTVALIDATTGLQNQKHFNISLTKEVMAARRDNAKLSVIMMNIDSLRLYRMTYGHAATVKMLRRITRCMRRGLFRPRDFIARFSSDEFGIILPGTDYAGARLVANRLKKLILVSCSHTIQAHLGQQVDVHYRVMEWNSAISTHEMKKMITECMVECSAEANGKN